MSFLYGAALLFAIAGTGLLDLRHRLAVFGGAPGRTAVIVSVSVVFFLIWDIAGIATGVFFRGSGPWMTSILLGPELPLEELFFLILLSYSTLVSYLLATRLLSRSSAR
jgi:lycopene cyclase domain-containing protein